MYKIICEECGKVFDSTLKQCPNCGYKRYHLKAKKIIKKSVIITSIVLVVTGSIILFNYFANLIVFLDSGAVRHLVQHLFHLQIILVFW